MSLKEDFKKFAMRGNVIDYRRCLWQNSGFPS